jgi:uncharacterized protein YdaT
VQKLVVYCTLADMFLRNKTEQLANTALYALGLCVGKRKYANCAVLKAYDWVRNLRKEEVIGILGERSKTPHNSIYEL